MTLAQHANTALYASMIVLALALVVFTGHLALRAPERSAVRAGRERQPALVGADRGPDAASVGSLEGDFSTGEASAAPVGGGPDRALKARQRGGIALMLTYLGTALLVASVTMRGIAVARPPWGNMFEFATAAAAAVMTVYSLLAKRNSWQWLGAFVTGVALLVLGPAVVVLYTEAGQLMPALRSYWLGIHVTIAVTAVALFTISAITGALYLVRRHRAEKTAAPTKTSWLDSLPAAEALERTTYSLNVAGFILWTFTVIAGAIWAKEAWGSYWQWDPKEVWSFVIWAVYAAYLHARATAGVDLRRANLIGLVGFVCVVVNFTLVNLVSTFIGMHNYSGMM